MGYSEDTAGALYSQLTGVLAGFAFAGLVLVLTKRLESGASPTSMQRSLILLVTSFVGLAVTSLGYAIVGGETNPKVADIEHVSAGVGFAASALTLLLAILELFREASLPDARPFVLGLAAGGAPIVAVVYVLAGIYTAAVSHHKVSWLLIIFLAFGIAAQVGVYAIARRRSGVQRQPESYTRLSLVVLVLVVGSSVSIPLISSLSGGHAPFFIAWIALPITVAGTGAFTTFVFLSEP